MAEDRRLSDSVVGELLTPPDAGETILSRWSHHDLSSSPNATIGHGEPDDLTPPEINTRTVRLTNEPHDDADYVVIGRLGAGGMGVVVEAEQVYFKRRRVALKMIRPELAPDPHAVQAFFREAVITSTMDHPGVVPILDFGVSRDGRAFYAMKKASGTPWNRIIHDKPLDDNLDILDRVADIVAYAHSQGVLHRDLKPANVMLGEFGEVWLGDWGVAVKRNSAGDFSHAHPGGTPHYMAPEAAACQFREFGERSDVYSLGAILFEILNGAPPHPGDTPAVCLVNAANNVIRAGMAHDALADIAKQAMETMPHRRYASVMDFQKTLRACRTGRRSSALVQEGLRILSRAKNGGDYDLFTRAIATFDNALSIDPQNSSARSNKTKAIFAYFKVARAKGEHDLAASILQGLPGNRQAAELLRDNATLKKRASRRKRNYRAAALGGVVVLLAALGVALWYNSYTRSRFAMTREDARQERVMKDEHYLAQEMARAFRQLRTAAVHSGLYRMTPLTGKSGYQETEDACAPSVKRLAGTLDAIWDFNYLPNIRDIVACHKFCRLFAQKKDELKTIAVAIKADAEKAPADSSRNLLSLEKKIDNAIPYIDAYRLKYMDDNKND